MKKLLSLAICLAMLMSLFPGSIINASASDTLITAGGSGTAEDPYLIATADQFESIFFEVINDDGTKSYPYASYHYLQIADIDLSELESPHDPKKLQLKGSYKGLEDPESGVTHRIINFGSTTVATSAYGMFYNVASGGVVENIGVMGSIKSTHTDGYVGSIAAYNYGTINNCFSTASVSAVKGAGGITACNFAYINNCYTTGNIIASGNYAGGIAAVCESGKVTAPYVTNCYATGNVSAATYAGGIMGQVGTKATTKAYTYTVSDCYFTGLITGNRSGGIIGAAPDSAQSGKTTLVAQNCYSLNPALIATKFCGYGVNAKGKYYKDKAFTVRNNYYFTCEENGYVQGTDSRATAVTIDDLTGPEISAKLVGFSSDVWGFMVNGGNSSYKFPQLKSNPHVVTITDENITNNIGVLPAPVITSVNTLISKDVVVTIDDSGLNDIATSFTVLVKDAATGNEIDTVTSIEKEIDITSVINNVEKNYLISVKADNGYKNNGSDYSSETSFTYVEPKVEPLETPVISGCTYDAVNDKYTLTFGAVNKATSYEVKVGEKVKTVNSTSADITDLLLPAGDYEVSVKAKSSDSESMYSDLYPVSSYYGGGSGTEGDEYKIYLSKHFNNIKYHNDKNFIIMNDISETITEPIETFSGVLKGNGLVTIDVNISGTDKIAVGLIEEITGEAVIENIKLTGSVTANGGSTDKTKPTVNYVGALIAQASNPTSLTVKNCVNAATVTNNGIRHTGYYGTGGLLGYTGLNTTIENCSNEGTVFSKNNVNAGGIAGYIAKPTCIIRKSVNKGSVNCLNGTVGGIVGANYGLVSECANYASIVNPSANNLGGIAGTSVGIDVTGITKCYNAGNIVGRDRVGGISGSGAPGTKNTTYTIEKSFNTGNIYGSLANVGSILGFFGNASRAGNITINECYDAQMAPMTILGGIQSEALVPTVSINKCYFLNDIEADTTGFKGESKTSDGLKTLITDGHLTNTDWEIKEGYEYPQLKNVAVASKIASEDTMVKVICGENGTITPSGDTIVAEGSKVTFVITPAENYRLQSLKLNGVEIQSGTVGEFSYQTPALMNHTKLEVTFEEIPPVAPTLTTYDKVFNIYESISVPVMDRDGKITGIKTVSGPKGMIFAIATPMEGFTLKEYGMLFSKTVSVPELNAEGCTKVEAVAPMNSLGQYGMLFYGNGLTVGNTYYTRAYSIYEKDGEDVVIYADAVSFVPAAAVE